MKVTKWAVALLCGMALALPVAAQDDASPKDPSPEPSSPPDASAEPSPTPPAPKKQDFGDPPTHRWGGMTISVAAWEPTLVGAEEELATTYQNGISHPLLEGSTAHIRETVGVLYHLSKDLGSIGLSYDSIHQSDSARYLAPGEFIFGETRGYPDSLGAFDDGLADGVIAKLDRKTREFRLFYSRTAFEHSRAKGTWSAGYRQLSHSRETAISYLALVPNLPPLIPPSVPDNADPNRLQPLPDKVSQTASFTGHGLGVGLDIEFPIHPRVSVITGISVGLIRGTASSGYTSISSYYYEEPDSIDVPLTRDQLFTILATGTESQILKVGQQSVLHGLGQSPTAQSAETLDIYLGLAVKVYRGLKVFGTLRDLYYANVGEYVVPRPGSTNARTPLSAGYEGYVIGLSWRF